MGLYVINCSACNKGFMWWSGNLDTRCPDCQNKNPALTPIQLDAFMDDIDKSINLTPLVACGHLPCNLAGCQGCKNHCSKKGKRG